jgi:hypothetical protein
LRALVPARALPGNVMFFDLVMVLVLVIGKRLGSSRRCCHTSAAVPVDAADGTFRVIAGEPGERNRC